MAIHIDIVLLIEENSVKHIKFLLIFFMALLSFACSIVYANIFAAHVQLEFDGTFPATIRYRLNENATSVTVYIKKDQIVVRTLTGVGEQLARSQDTSILWDGILDGGDIAAGGVYTVEIEEKSIERYEIALKR